MQDTGDENLGESSLLFWTKLDSLGIFKESHVSSTVLFSSSADNYIIFIRIKISHDLGFIKTYLQQSVSYPISIACLDILWLACLRITGVLSRFRLKYFIRSGCGSLLKNRHGRVFSLGNSQQRSHVATTTVAIFYFYYVTFCCEESGPAINRA